MIKIEKEGNVIICTEGTFNSMYKRLGYKKVENQKENKVKVSNTFETSKIPEIPDLFNEEEQPKISTISKKVVGKNKNNKIEGR